MIWYYLFILVIGSFAAFLSQTRSKGGISQFHPIPFFVSFVIIFIFTCFSNSGDDYDSFYEIIDTISWDVPIFGTSEIGFNYLCLAIKSLVDSPDIVLFALKALTLFFIFQSLYLLRHSISIGFSYLVYVLLYWLPSLFVIPLFFSASLCTLAFAIFLKKGIRIFPIILIILAAQVHTGAYFALIFLGYVFFIKKKENYFWNNAILVSAVAIGTILITILINYLSTYGVVHYDEYERSAGGTGLKTIIEYFILLIIVLGIKRYAKDNYFSELVFVFYVFDFSISVINFSYGTAGRMHYLMMSFYILLLSQYCYSKMKKLNLPAVFLFLLCLINGFLTYVNFTSGPIVFVDYHMFNPFK